MNGIKTSSPSTPSGGESVYMENEPAGMLPAEIYDGTLNWWRSGIRRLLVKNLERESRWIGQLQVCVIDRFKRI
jgi:hypothetical protein